MLVIRGLAKSYSQPDGAVEVLKHVDLDLTDGRSAALLGESGSGKSTLLHLVAGLDAPDAGSITLDNVELTALGAAGFREQRRARIGLVFQQYHLVSTLTVDDNIRLQARLAGRVDDALVQRLIEALGLGDLTGRLPHELSGGQQQRVAIARGLAHRPSLVLADEPTGNLDEGASRAVMPLFTELAAETGSSLLMVTHSDEMAGWLDERWRLSDGTITRLTE